MVCEYNSNVLTALSLAINLVRLENDFIDDDGRNDDAGAN
jgi:hypothetical protein